MSYGPGASLGGGLQVCAIGQLCWLSDSSDPFSPSEGCSNAGPGDGSGDDGPSDGGGSCSNPAAAGPGEGGGSGPWGGTDGSGNGGSPQYQLFNSVILPYRPRHRKPIHYVLHGLGENVSCAPPPGTAPQPVPGPSSAYSQAVIAYDQVAPFGNVSGLSITCLTTGVTLTSGCPATLIQFYFDTTGTKSYTIAGGSGTNCQSMNGYTYSSGAGTALVPLQNDTVINVSHA